MNSTFPLFWYVKKLELIELLKDNETNANRNPKPLP